MSASALRHTHSLMARGFYQTIERHDFGEQAGLGAEANLSKDLVQSQPLPDLAADMDCSSLSGLFNFDLLYINVAASLALLFGLGGSHCRLLD